jgi:hypothetical protein
VVELPPCQQLLQCAVKPELTPEVVRRKANSQRSALRKRQVLTGGGLQCLLGLKLAGESGHPLRGLPVELVLASETVEHLGLGLVASGIPLVVGKLEVPGHRAVLVWRLMVRSYMLRI